MSTLTPRSRLVLAVQRSLIRLAKTPLRGALAACHRIVARAAALYLARGQRDADAYVRGGPGGDDDFWPGLSDLDLAFVVAEPARAPGTGSDRIRNRWQRLRRAVPAVTTLLDWPRVYGRGELAELVGSSAFTFGLDADADAPAGLSGYFGKAATLDRIRMLERPGLYSATGNWRPLSGLDRRPPEPPRDAQARRVAAWLELLYWWRWAVPFCVEPIMPRTADLCVKLIAEPARIWLWLAHGERAPSRDDALQRALRRLPEEEEGLRFALDLRRALPDSPPAPLSRAVPVALAISRRIAELIAAEISGEGAVEVRLAGERQDGEPLPLADWRALACGNDLEESFLRLSGNAGDPSAIAAAATAHPSGAYPALDAGGVLLMPAAELRRNRLRAIKCAAADPVVFALRDGSDAARFPEVRGWSAADTARRAVAEHRARLAASSPASGGSEAGSLLAAGRAGLFHDSVARGDPELCLTPAAVADRLAVAGAPAPGDRTAELRDAVLSLPAYS